MSTSQYPHRTGLLEKKGHVWTAWRGRFVVLKDGKLAYYKSGQVTASGYVPIGAGWTVEQSQGNDQPFAFTLAPPSNSAGGNGKERQFVFSAKTAKDRDDWMSDIRKTIDMYNRAKPEAKKEESNTSKSNLSGGVVTSGTNTQSSSDSNKNSTTSRPNPPQSVPNQTTTSNVPTQPKPVPISNPQPTLTEQQQQQQRVGTPKRDVVPKGETGIELSTLPQTKSTVVVPEQIEEKDSKRPQKSASKSSRCACCKWFTLILFFLLTVLASAVATSALDQESQVGAVAESAWEFMKQTYFDLEAKFMELPLYGQVSILVVVVLVVVLLVFCLVRRQRKNKEQRFAKLAEEGETVPEKSSGCWKSVLLYLFFLILFSLVAIVATSILDRETYLWSQTLNLYHGATDWMVSPPPTENSP